MANVPAGKSFMRFCSLRTPFAALLSRALMLRTRAAGPAWMRIGVGVWLGVLVASIENQGASPFRRGGLDLIQSIAIVGLLGMGFAVLAAMAGAVVEEKEQRTLGLLRMTNLSPAGILLAKCAGRLAEILILLATTLPLALVAVSLGGVTATQVISTYVALTAWLVLLAAFGLCWSVWMKSANAALGCAVGCVALFIGGMIFTDFDRSDDFVRYLIDYSVLGRMRDIFDSARTGSALSLIGAADAIQSAIALGFFVLAIRTFPAGDGDTPLAPTITTPARVRRFLPSILTGKPWRLFMPRPLTGNAAIAWKEFHIACGGWAGMVISLLLPLLYLSFRILFMAHHYSYQHGSYSDDSSDDLRQYILAALAIFALRVGIWLGNLIGAELRQGTFDDLATLPLPMGGLLVAKLRGTAWAALALFMPGLLALLYAALARADISPEKDAIPDFDALVWLFGRDFPIDLSLTLATGTLAFWLFSLRLSLTHPRNATTISLATLGVCALLLLNLDDILRGFSLSIGEQEFYIGLIASALIAATILAVQIRSNLRRLTR